MKSQQISLAVNDQRQWFGACRLADPKLFFPAEGEQTSAGRERTSAAKHICASCPVIQSCRQESPTLREPFGVWGGLAEDDREAVYRPHPESNIDCSR
jgi:WhiB family redox-sensing transcriptional regulator